MAGWEVLLALPAGGPKSAHLIAALRAAVADGRLAAGARLPATRDLAADLGVSRGVVVAAYEQLVAEGRLVARQGAGTMVAPTSVVAPRPVVAPGPGIAPGPVVAAGGPVRPPTLLRPGVPDLAAFPRAAWRRCYEEALASVANADLDYGDPAGVAPLRAELAGYLGRVRAARVTPTAVVVTTGAAQAVALLAGVLRRRGHSAIGLEDPGSIGIRDLLRLHGLTTVPVPVDAGGVAVDRLVASGVRAVFLTPAHQFPTGVVLAPDRRAALVGWARRTGSLIIEDDYDAEFRYDREPVGCVQGVAPDVVALVGSTSKSMAPALRLGWLATPDGWQVDVGVAKARADQGSPVLEQFAFARLLAGGGYDRHLRRVRRGYRARRDAVVAAVRRYLPAARVSGVAAGLHLVLELPAGVDDVALAGQARAVGLCPLALSTSRQLEAGPPGLVLGYATHRPDELVAAVRRLAGLPALADSPASGQLSGGLARWARPSA